MIIPQKLQCDHEGCQQQTGSFCDSWHVMTTNKIVVIIRLDKATYNDIGMGRHYCGQDHLIQAVSKAVSEL